MFQLLFQQFFSVSYLRLYGIFFWRGEKIVYFISNPGNSAPNLRQSVPYLSSCPSASSENDWDFQFCGTWHHGGRPRSLSVNVSTGCEGIAVSANQSSLSISGKLTSQCNHSRVISLTDKDELNSAESHFCLYWEPFYDQLKLQVKDGRFLLPREWNDAGGFMPDLFAAVRREEPHSVPARQPAGLLLHRSVTWQ